MSILTVLFIGFKHLPNASDKEVATEKMLKANSFAEQGLDLLTLEYVLHSLQYSIGESHKDYKAVEKAYHSSKDAYDKLLQNL